MKKYLVLNKSLAILIINILILTCFFNFPIACAEEPNNVDDLIFIHHSCGERWLNHGLENALLDKDYIDEVNEIYYNDVVSNDSGRPKSLGNEPGDHTNMNHWILWFNDYLEGVKNYECTDGYNKIIMFKSCYPISNVVGNGTEPGNPFSSTQTIANYKAVYRHYNGPGENYTYDGYIYKPLEDIFAENPDVLFVPVTAPPRHYAPEDATTDAEAHRARLFNNWLKNDWLDDYNTDNPDLNNVAVYDWFNFLAYPDDNTDHPNRLKSEYGGERGDSHPTLEANKNSTKDFAEDSPNFIDTAWRKYLNSTLLIINPNPSNGATDVSKNLSELSISISDPEGDNFNWTIETSPDIGSAYGSVESNGTKYCNISGLEYETLYTWYVNATDTFEISSGSMIYSFTTAEETSSDPGEDLDCSGSLSFSGISPSSIVTGNFSVENVGYSGTNLEWEIDTYPDWGTWYFDPENGMNLTPENAPVIVNVEITAPDEENTQFIGEVKVINSKNNSDYEIIPVSLATPKIENNSKSSKNSNYNYISVPVIPEPPVNEEVNITKLIEFIQSIFEFFPLFQQLFFFIPFFIIILNNAIFLLKYYNEI
jgi:hypothetical protein